MEYLHKLQLDQVPPEYTISTRMWDMAKKTKMVATVGDFDICIHFRFRLSWIWALPAVNKQLWTYVYLCVPFLLVTTHSVEKFQHKWSQSVKLHPRVCSPSSYYTQQIFIQSISVVSRLISVRFDSSICSQCALAHSL